jgi:hypothetical protein
MQTLREHGWMEAYERAAEPRMLETIQTAAVGSWLPIEVAASHYGVSESLGVPLLEQLEIGGAVVKRLQQTLLGRVTRVARASGAVSPLTVLRRFNQLHARSWIGSAGQVVELGPKDVRLDIVGLPLFHIPYFRTSYRGFLRAAAHLFADHAFVTEVALDQTANAASYRFAWV